MATKNVTLTSSEGGDYLFPRTADGLVTRTGGTTVQECLDVLEQRPNRTYNALKNTQGYLVLSEPTDNATSFSSQISGKTNTIFEIRDNFNLGGNTVTIPAGCTLKFEGGSITNGTLNLNSCVIEGSGIKCNISNPKKAEYPLSYYLSDISDSERNHDVVQVLLDARVKIINDYKTEVVFDDYLSIKQSASVTGGSWSFPDSRGFVWDGQGASSSGNSFSNLTIVSDGHCFDFVNSGDANRPANVYLSRFENINATSSNGDCFTAGQDDYGSGGDNCSFSNYFENITISAPNGSGFKGHLSNTQQFVKCTCFTAGEAFFFNCAGIFDSCNGAWGTSTRTFYKGRQRTNGVAIGPKCTFNNCNVESYRNGNILFDCGDIKFYADFVIKNCTFYVYPDEGTTVNHFPFNIGISRRLVWENNTVNVSGTYGTYTSGSKSTPYALFYIGAGMGTQSGTSITTDTNLSYVDVNTYAFTALPSGRYSTNSTYIASGSQLKWLPQIASDLRTVNFAVDCVKYVAYAVTFSNPYEISVPYKKKYSFTTSSDQAGDNNFVINYFQLLPPSTAVLEYRTGFEFTIVNGNTNRSITFSHNLGYNGRFVCINGSSITLAPGESAICLNKKSGSVYFNYIEKMEISKYKAGSIRPSDVLAGYSFFDTSLGMNIYWNGSKWVDNKGFSAGPHRGTTANRPVGDQVEGGILDATDDIGYEYFDTTLKKPIYVKQINNGTVVWVDATGTEIDQS